MDTLFELPLVSKHTLAAISKAHVPSTVGVKVAVYAVPTAVNAVSVPLVSVMSVSTKPVTGLVGVNVKLTLVSLVVSPAVNSAANIVKKGAIAS